MRLDKYLKVSRIIKRRTVANEICASGRVFVNGKTAKPSTTLKIGDEVTLVFGTGETSIVVKELREHVRKNEAISLYELQEGKFPGRTASTAGNQPKALSENLQAGDFIDPKILVDENGVQPYVEEDEEWL